MLSALFTSVADALISYAIDKLDPAEKVKSWLKLEPAQLAFEKAFARGYAAFARQYPEYVASLFNDSFLKKEALAELSKLLTRNQHPDPALLARAWGQSIGADADFTQAATKPASYFVERLEAELKAESALQALFDSRALESLPKLEADIQKLAGELKRGLDTALKVTSDYQKVTLHIEGDVKDSNIIIGDNNVINKYYYSGDFVSLNEYYIPPDGVFQRVRVDEFVGRDWLTAKVDAFLNDPSRKSGAFLLVGDAGVGKTAFMAHLVKERRYLHLFAEQVPGQAMLQRALQSLGSQLVTRYQIDPYKDRDTLNVLAGFPDFLERLLRLAASTLTEGEKIVIVCDALDEAGVSPDHFVFGLPKELPNGVYLILSQRPVNTKLPNFEPLRFDLESQGEDNLQDMEDYLSTVAKRPAVAGQIRAKDYSEDFFVQTLKEKSLGVWMYLHYIVKEIEDGARAPLDLASLPKGLVGYYADYWDDWRYGRKGRGKGEEAWNELYAPLLTTLAAAQDAITAEQLTSWAGVKVDPDTVDALLHNKWRSFILEKEVEGNILYAPYHLSFRDFITGKVDVSKLPVEQANLVRDLSKKIVKAHKRIVDTFEVECNGKWEKLVEQDYPRLHLTAHLNGAKEYKKLTDLLTEGNEKIMWAEAREKKEETYAGYLNDLTYVWVYAEREQNYALAIRCMLIENSIHSLASNIPPKLLAELAKVGMWSYARCLSTIQENSSSRNKAQSIELIGPDLPPLLLQDMLIAACEIKDEGYRASILPALAPHLNDELKTQALVAARHIKDQGSRASALSNLAPHLNNELKTQALQEALSAAREIKDELLRADALSDLTPHLNDELKIQVLQEALSAAREIKDEQPHASVLSHLVPLLNDELKTQVLQEALDATRELISEGDRIWVLSVLVPHLNDEIKTQVLQDSLVAAREIKDEMHRADVLFALAPYLNDELKTEALLVVAHEIKDESSRVHALSALAPYLNDELNTQALAAACGIKVERLRANVLSVLAPHLNEDLKTLALAAAREIKDEGDRARVLSDLLPHLNDDLKAQVLQEALAAAHEIKDEHPRAKVLSDLAPHFNDELKNQVLQEALDAAREIKDEWPRASVLATFAPYLNEELRTQVLQDSLAVACESTNEWDCASILSAFAPHLNEELKTQALAVARKIKNEWYRARVLSTFAPYLNDELKTQVLQEALDATREIKSEWERARVLSDLVPYFNNEFKMQSVSVTREMQDESPRVSVLSDLMPYLNDELKTEVLAAVREIKDERLRARVLSTFAPYLNEELRTQALQDSLAAAREIKNEWDCASILSAFAPHLNEELKTQALAVAREIKNEWHRARVLSDLVPYLNDELKTQALKEALVAAREIKDELLRARLLSNLLPHLNDELQMQVLQEALDATREIKSEWNRASALSDLVPYLNNEHKTRELQEALTAVREMKYDGYRVRALSALIPLFNKEIQIIVFQELLYLQDSNEWDSHIGKAINTWKKMGFEGLAENIISFFKWISQKDRKKGLEVVEKLTPALIHFRGPKIADELYRAITDVTRWWP